MTKRIELAKEYGKSYPKRVVCKVLGVNRSTVYYGRAPMRPLEPLAQVVMAFRASLPQTGVKGMYEVLRRYHVFCTRNEVRKVYKMLGILGKPPKPRIQTTNSRHEHPVYPDIVKGLPIQRPNQVWAADVTHVRVAKSWCYLALIMDLYSRMIVGWALDTSNNALLCIEALESALRTGRPEIHHSDQDTSYASGVYIRMLKGLNILISMTKTASPWDNGNVERLNKTIKHEEVLLNEYLSLEEARKSIASWVELYNNGRLHVSLGYLTPAEFFEMYEPEADGDEKSP